MSIPSDCSWVWRNVFKAREDAAEYIIYSIANGENTLLWHDLWCGKKPLYKNEEAKREWLHSFPNDAKVSSLISNNKWNQHVNMLSCYDLKKQISSIVISSNLLSDRVIWSPSPNGIYTTKSAYTSIRGKSNRVSWFRLVWGKLNSPKHSFSLWQLFSGSLLTQDRLIKRKFLIQSKCILCNHNRENSKHLFFECVYSKEVWTGVKAHLQLLTDSSDSNKEWRCLLKMCRKKDLKAEITKALIAATVNFIWMERNNRKFKNQFLSAREVTLATSCYVKKLLATQKLITADWYLSRMLLESLGVTVQLKKQKITQCAWNRPPESYFKLNSDGSYKGGKGGYGGILRNELGNPILGYSGGGAMTSIEEVEMFAILQGCTKALEIGCLKLIVHSDSLRVIQAILGRETTPWYCENILAGIKNILQDFEVIVFEHCLRECNSVADNFAKYQSIDAYCIAFFPPFDDTSSELIERDKRGTVTLRFS